MANHRQEPSSELPAVIETPDQADRFSIASIGRWIKKHPKTSAGIGGGLAATVAGGIFAANVMRGPSDAPTPGQTTTSEPTEPTASPTPTETETPVVIPEKFDFNVDEQTIAQFHNEGQDSFVARDVRERVLLDLYYAENMPEFAADWYAVSKNPNDQLTALPSVDMTPQQIVTWTGYMQRMPETIQSVGDNYYLDIDAAYKMAAGNFVDPLSPSTAGAYQRYLEHINEQTNDGGRVDTARSLAVSGYFEMSVADESNSTELLEDANGFYRTVRVVNADSVVQDITYRWVVATNNVGTWVIESQTAVE